jgi:hypothetical protein
MVCWVQQACGCSGGVGISVRSRSRLIDAGRSGQRILPMAAGHCTVTARQQVIRCTLRELALPGSSPGVANPAVMTHHPNGRLNLAWAGSFGRCSLGLVRIGR